MNEIKVTVGRHRMLMIRIVSGALAIVCAVYTLGIFKSIWNNTYWQLMYSGTLIFSLMMPLLFLSGTIALSAVAYVAKPYEILINSERIQFIAKYGFLLKPVWQTIAIPSFDMLDIARESRMVSTGRGVNRVIIYRILLTQAQTLVGQIPTDFWSHQEAIEVINALRQVAPNLTLTPQLQAFLTE